MPAIVIDHQRVGSILLPGRKLARGIGRDRIEEEKILGSDTQVETATVALGIIDQDFGRLALERLLNPEARKDAGIGIAGVVGRIKILARYNEGSHYHFRVVELLLEGSLRVELAAINAKGIGVRGPCD